MLHASGAGVKTIRLPSPQKVTDMVTGKVIGNNITEFQKEMDFGETALFELQECRPAGNAD